MLASTQFPPRVICCGVTITQTEALFIKHSASWGWCCSLRHENLFGPWATSAAPPPGPPPSTFLMALGMGHSNHHATPTVAGRLLSLQHHQPSFSLEPEASWLMVCGDWGGAGWGGCGKASCPCRAPIHAGEPGSFLKTSTCWNFSTAGNSRVSVSTFSYWFMKAYYLENYEIFQASKEI